METVREPKSYQYYFEGGGEMGENTRNYNWKDSILGPPETWPQSLLITISTVLRSKFPMFIWWGPELIQFYNDAYRPSLGNNGKHPAALGQRGEDCWPEIWPVIKPLIDQVMEGGESTWSEDQLIPIYRNDRMEDVYWTFSYMPILNEDGKPGGVLVICNETTEKVLASKKLNDANNKLKQSQAETALQRDRLTQFFMQAPAGICVLDGPQFVFELVNPGYQQLFPGRDLLGKPLLEAFPEVKGQATHEILQKVYETGESFEGSELLVPMKRFEHGPIEDRYFNFIYQARLNAENQVDGILVFVIEVTKSVTAQKLAKANEHKLKSMLDTIPQMIWTNTLEGEVNFHNQRWYDYTGIDYDQTKTWDWKPVVHPDDLNDTLENGLGILQSGVKGEFESRYKRADGEYRWHLNRIMPLKNEDGELKLWIGTATDIHDLKQLQQQKDDFISIASHELKTPLTTLKAYLQVIQRIKNNSAPEIFGGMIDKSVKSLDKINNLIEDLLNATKLNHGQLSLNKSYFNLSAALSECLHHVYSEGNYIINIHGDKNIEVYADPERIEQVVINLVNNAIKYAPESRTIEINIEKNMPMVKVSITDKGPGIPEEKISNLFDRFYRGNKNEAHYAGLGLGLYICAEIIERHSGNMGVDSKLGVGSTFWFELPA